MYLISQQNYISCKKYHHDCGSDRVKEFERLLESYNGVEGKRHGYYKFDSIKSYLRKRPRCRGCRGYVCFIDESQCK